MTGFVERAVLRLREGGGFSRNRHYQALSSPEGRRALRIHRHLRSLEIELSGGCAAEVERQRERVRLTLRCRRGVRVAYLAPDEFRLLLANPIVRAALGEAASRALG